MLYAFMFQRKSEQNLMAIGSAIIRVAWDKQCRLALLVVIFNQRERERVIIQVGELN